MPGEISRRNRGQCGRTPLVPSWADGGEFDYINRTYGLSLTKNCAVVKADGQRGQVACADGAHIHIRWDGAKSTQGPYHPTWELTYPGPEPKP